MIKLFMQFLRVIIIVIFIFTIVPAGFFFATGRTISNFCTSIKPNDEIANIWIKAEQKELLFQNRDTKIQTGDAYIYNQEAPFGRLACVISLENGKVIKTDLIAED